MPRELLICGPAGTGKTYPILAVLHCLAREYPLRVLFLRATRGQPDRVRAGHLRAGDPARPTGASRSPRARAGHTGTRTTTPTARRSSSAVWTGNPTRILSTAWDPSSQRGDRATARGLGNDRHPAHPPRPRPAVRLDARRHEPELPRPLAEETLRRRHDGASGTRRTRPTRSCTTGRLDRAGTGLSRDARPTDRPAAQAAAGWDLGAGRGDLVRHVRPRRACSGEPGRVRPAAQNLRGDRLGRLDRCRVVSGPRAPVRSRSTYSTIISPRDSSAERNARAIKGEDDQLRRHRVMPVHHRPGRRRGTRSARPSWPNMNGPGWCRWTAGRSGASRIRSSCAIVLGRRRQPAAALHPPALPAPDQRAWPAITGLSEPGN